MAVFIAHAALFGSWIVDDAGITFAYARSLAEGGGLVAQQGSLPVEGFSNALWTLLLAATHVLGLFDPVLTPKVLSGILVWLSFLGLSLALVAGFRRSATAVGLALTATAAATPFTVWTISGLENALLVCGIAGLAAITLRLARRKTAEPGEAALVGGLCFLLFLTRPDGIVYLPLPTLILTAVGCPWSRRHSTISLLAFLGPWIALTIGRIAYFGDVLPNTYYAKRGPGWQETRGLLESLGLPLGGLVFMAVVVIVAAASMWAARWIGARLHKIGSQRPAFLVLGAYFLTSYVIFELLPTDWMPEYRFGTALFLLGPLVLLEGFHLLPDRVLPSRLRGNAAWIPAALCLLAAGLYSARQTESFRKQPTVPFDDIRTLSETLDRYASSLGVDRATILLPDIGGSLWEDRFEVLDLAGLTDKTIGPTLRTDREAFLTYLSERSPDLLWAHGHWNKLLDLGSSAELSGEYSSVSAQEVLGRTDGSLYVRSELVSGVGGGS